MPELPEVEIMTRNVRRWAEGRVVRRFGVNDEKVVVRDIDLVERIAGAGVTGVRRRAKHMLIQLDSVDLAVHFRMTGKVVRGPADGRVRWFAELDDGSRVDFVDSRRLGELRVFEPGGAEAWVESLGLGPDAWPGARDGAWWAERLRTKRGPIKPALLDQARVAGVGNILASELLWRCGISPERPVPSLRPAEWEAIAANVGPLIEDVLRGESGDEIVYVNESPDAGAVFRVYRRDGDACARCGGEIGRTRQAGRSTFWCSACQS